LIAIRSPVIGGDHLRSRTSLIAITSTAQLRGSGLSHLLYKLGLTRHLATSCTVLHATRGGEDSRRSITASAASCALWGGDQEVPEWALQWLVAGNRTHVYQLQGGQRARPRGSAANFCL